MDDFKKLENALNDIRAKSVPFVIMKTMTNVAFTKTMEAKALVKKEFINRNSFTAKSLQYEKATKQNPVASYGSTQEYMNTQEFGDIEKKKGKHGVTVPQPRASAEEVSPRHKTIRKANLLKNMKLSKRNKANPWGHVYAEARRGAKFAFLEFDNSQGQVNPKAKGIYALKRKSKGKGPRGGKRFELTAKKTYDMSNRQIHIYKTKWMTRNNEDSDQLIKDTYAKNLQQEIENQMRRNQIKKSM